MSDGEVSSTKTPMLSFPTPLRRRFGMRLSARDSSLKFKSTPTNFLLNQKRLLGFIPSSLFFNFFGVLMLRG